MKAVSIFLIVLLLLAASLLSCRQTTPGPPLVEPPAQTEENPPPSSTEDADEDQADRLMHPSLLFLGRTPDGKSLVYTLGYEFGPSQGRQSKDEPLDYDFPLYLTRAEQGEPKQTLAVIPDPELQEIGAEWLSDIIPDPVYEGYLLRVKLIRVEKQYEYQMELHISGDNGQSWQGRDFAWPFD